MPTGLNSIWDEICDSVKSMVSGDTYERWFSKTRLIEASEDVITVEVPSNIYKLWIESNYDAILGSSIAKVLGHPRRVEFQFSEPEEKPARDAGEAGLAEVPTPAEDGNGAADEKSSELIKQGLEEGGRPTRKGMNGAAKGLNGKNTFESFVVGSNNKFAWAAARAVAESPAMNYNPLFIYSGVGLGKTHLMHSIGQAILKRNKRAKVLYVTSEVFTNDFIDALQTNSLVQFRKRYRKADVLLIDDIQFVARKEATQEEFFHTFNSLSDGHKQIVLSSDRPPSEIANLERRLVSRFEWGLTAEVQPPDMETRVAILRKKMEDWQVTVDDEVVNFLAEKIRSNVRRLEGGLMRVASYFSLTKDEVNEEALEDLLKDILQEEAKEVVTIDQIQKRVAEYYDVRIADMMSKRRPANIAFPRQVAMYLARQLTDSSLNEIGDAFGGRDHGTVIHAIKTVKAKMELKKEIRQAVSFLHDRIRE